jgi:succinate dehydrogenase/fumarate reductase flavoprotein subunit
VRQTGRRLPMSSSTEIVNIDTDVLIIGGGLAGCMAAIKARESDVTVTIVEKGNTLSSGCAGTGIDHVWGYIPPIHEQMGWTIDDLVADHAEAVARGFINKELLYIVASESYERVLDLERFGVNFRYDDGNVPGGFRLVHQFHSVPTTFNFDGRDLKVKLTKEARRRGVSIVNRVMAVELLTNHNQVTGALGVGTNDGKIYYFRANAVVVSTGRSNRLSGTVTGVWGNHRIPYSETGDGRAMGMRAGLPIINMEFYSSPYFSIGNFELNLGSPRNTVQPAAAVTGRNGEVIIPRTTFYDWNKLGKVQIDPIESRKTLVAGFRERPPFSQWHREGKGPFFLDLTGGTEEEIRYIEWSIGNEGKGSLFLDYLKNQEHFDFRKDKLEWLPNSREMAGTAASGFWVDSHMETEVKNLFGAGDDVGGVPWMCSPGAFTMGWKAGSMAAEAAQKQKSLPDRNKENPDRLSSLCLAISGNKHGLHWREVEMSIQQIVDHYAGETRSAAMLKRGAERLKAIRQAATFSAANPHELLRCLEVMSILDNADMVFAASLEREESRRAPFGFFRADFPEQNDREWLAFIALKMGGDGFRFSKIPITP